MKKFAVIMACLVGFNFGVQAQEAKTEEKGKEVQVSADVKKAINTAESSVSWLGKKKLVGDKHNGKIKIKDGIVTIDAKGQPKDAIITIDMASISNEDLKDKAYNKKLVDHLSSADFFDVKKYPTAILKINNFAKTKADKKSAVKNAHLYKATGDLTIKDKTEKVGFDVMITNVDSVYKGTGKLVIDRTRWNVKYGSDSFFKGLGDKVIADDMEFDFQVVTLK